MNERKEKMIEETIVAGLSRRKFLTYAGALAGAGLLVSSVSSCKKDDDLVVPAGAIDLGSGDVGILNYAYALEQLEAAFYTRVCDTPYANISATEQAYLSDIRDHEIAHREFFKSALGNNAIQNLNVDFSKINFNERTSVLNAAKTFEDLGVQAYNGAGSLIVSADYLLLAGKIVSVEARHAALIRDLLSNGSFSDSTDANGLDMSMMPKDVVNAANGYLATKISANNLPTS